MQVLVQLGGRKKLLDRNRLRGVEREDAGVEHGLAILLGIVLEHFQFVLFRFGVAVL